MLIRKKKKKNRICLVYEGMDYLVGHGYSFVEKSKK